MAGCSRQDSQLHRLLVDAAIEKVIHPLEVELLGRLDYFSGPIQGHIRICEFEQREFLVGRDVSTCVIDRFDPFFDELGLHLTLDCHFPGILSRIS